MGERTCCESGTRAARFAGFDLALDLVSTERDNWRLMTTTIITPDQDAIVSEIDIAAPAERVFQALTDSAELKRWFTTPECPAKFWKMDARLGGRYGYATEKGSVVVNGVTRVRVPRRDPRIRSARASSSTPGSRTGTTTSRAAPSSAGNSRPRKPART